MSEQRVPRRILVLKPDHLGDLLLATPALSVLRQAMPAARIVGLVGPWARRIWQASPDLDALLDLPFPGFERTASRRRSLRPYLLLLRYAILVRRYEFDAALVLRDDHWWGAALAAAAAIPQRIGYAHPRCAPLLTTALPYRPREHVTHQALAIVAALVAGAQPSPAPSGPGIAFELFCRVGRGLGRACLPQTKTHHPSDWVGRHSGNDRFDFAAPALGARLDMELAPGAYGTPPTRFMPTPTEYAWAAGWLADRLAPAERLVVIHPGTGGPTKHWPPARWATVADALATAPAVRLLLTGGPGEAALVAEIASLMCRPAFSLVGQTNIGQLAALLGRADLVLGVDSGPLHLAVSQGAPTLHLYGPSDHARFGPWGDPARQRLLRAGLACSPCGVFTACPRATVGPECMTALTPDVVIAAAWAMLGAAG